MRILLSLFILSFMPPLAHAQFGFGGDGKVDIIATEATYTGGVTTLRGDVIVTQQDAVIRADKMTIYRAETADGRAALKLGEITRIVAEGNFSYEAPENKVTGNRGVYKRNQKQIDVFGNVVLQQPSGNVIESDTLFYDLEKKRARFKNEDGRVEFSIPNQ